MINKWVWLMLALPVRSLKDLVALAKAQPGKLNFASSGSGARCISPESC